MLLCYAGLAELRAFEGNSPAARDLYRRGLEAVRGGGGSGGGNHSGGVGGVQVQVQARRQPKELSRYLREWAAFEKRQGDLAVSAAACLAFLPACLHCAGLRCAVLA